MRIFFAPGLIFASCVVGVFALAAWVVFIALSQPWLGIELDPDGDSVVISRLEQGSTLPEDSRGQKLTGIAALDHPVVALVSGDLIEEPDMISTVAGLNAFYARQDRIFQALASGEVSVELTQGSIQNIVSADVRQTRPVETLPLKFWTQLMVGFVGLVIGAWVVCLRTRDLAAWMVLLTGIGLALSSGAAALYSSREIALSYEVFTTASRINGTGTLLFGIGMMTLFLIYPRVLVPKYLAALPALLIGGVILLIQLVQWPRYFGILQDVVALTMAGLLVAIGAQVFINRRNPTALAMLGWLGLCVAVGAGGFVMTAIVPTVFGHEVLLAQSTAFLFFLLIYIGIALGVMRYRLFDLATWSFGVFFYGFGVALLLLLDAALIYGLSVDRAPALGISLAVIGAIYLPFRSLVAQWLGRKHTMPAEELYRRVTEVSLILGAAKKQAFLIKLWEDVFAPLSVTALPAHQGGDMKLEINGSALIIAPVFGLPALRLEWARKGARLFSSRDLSRAKSINAFIDNSLRQNQSYLDAVDKERSRINRDMHDNIGILLVSALHVTNTDRKDALIRQTLIDLREIISNPDQHIWQLPQLIADLRAEVASHMDVANIAVEWDYGALPDVAVEPVAVHTLRALIREGTNNIVRHSGATNAFIRLSYDDPELSVLLSDNGHGFEQCVIQHGNGFKNLASRVTQIEGQFDVQSTASGTMISASFPLVQPTRRVTK